jgi:hypothetical protein
LDAGSLDFVGAKICQGTFEKDVLKYVSLFSNHVEFNGFGKQSQKGMKNGTGRM